MSQMINIHEDDDQPEEYATDDNGPVQEQDMEDTLSMEGSSFEDDDAESAVDDAVAEDIEKFKAAFKGIDARYRLINRIGEGTFSTVYKAEDLLYEHYHNDWDLEQRDLQKWTSPPLKKRRTGEYGTTKQTQRPTDGPRLVAIKKIYVTSSPLRIQNELELLNDLRGYDSVCPLITAFRYQDQVVAVLPYFKHVDFREYFRDISVPEMRIYFRSLFSALASVHKHNIIHRDIKPTNFLYDIDRQRGVLVDFGLAERQGEDCSPCLCQYGQSTRKSRIEAGQASQQPATLTIDRPSRRANRAGTRGFRAPEVLFKCTNQTTKIDIWSAGVILLTMLARRFPFFNSADDVDALIEISTIFGQRRMKPAALLHGAVFDTTLPSIGEKGFSLQKIVLWSTGRSGNKDDTKNEGLSRQEKIAVMFLYGCLDLDPARRISAEDALNHEFLAEAGGGGESEDEMEML
ncbi:MAG: hypothetical protein M1833_002350 [Piccolia ochrophora]|nr:MAG: hypothetical protein M1833_002350 [Piccolia ochrophora]